MSSIWRTLGIASTRDRTAIRRAYAARLKVVHPEDDAEGFQALRAAYEQALRLAAQAERQPNVVALADWDGEDEDVPEPVIDEAVIAQLMEIAGPPADRPEPEVAAPAPLPLQPGPQIDRVGREEVQALGAAMQALRQAVAADDKDSARTLLKTVLASPAMDAVSVRDQVEGELGGLILHGGMGAAVLIDPASAEFGWTDERLGGNAGLAQAVRARRADLAFLINIRSSQSGHHAAYRALTERPAGANLWRYRLTPGLPRAVRTLLDLIYGQHNSLARELDADAVAWWSAFFSRPQLGPGAF
ncbi:MAG TPA: J domain-containing protein, partial [Phenylobacterium sp.]